jgi:hypothetical protein
MPSPHAALIVDADPQGLESLVYGFQGAEWRMTACPSPETASLLVKASGAQIVVVASRTEHDRTYALVAQLRANEGFRARPILVLGPEELRPRLRSELDADLLPLPAFVRDVLTASELLVATLVGQRSEGDPCWRAPVKNGGILSLVRTMHGLGRSGQVRLERNGRSGEILFHEGELTAASIGPLQGMAALQHLMVWVDGKLDLRLRQVPRRGQLPLTAQEFLQETDRFQRDFAHAMKEIGPPTAVYSASQERLKQSSSAVPAEVTPVVRLCTGSRMLADIIDESPFRVLDTVRILGRLAELGIIIRSDGKPLAPPPADERLEAKIVGPSAAAAWPMPAPIGGFPLSTAIRPTPVPASQPARPTTPPLSQAAKVTVVGRMALPPEKQVTPRPVEEQVTPPPVEEQVTPPPGTPVKPGGRVAAPLEEQITPPPPEEEQVTPPPASQVTPPPEPGRPRRRTLEIGITAPPATATPAPAALPPRPTAVTTVAAAKTPQPVHAARGAGKTPKPVVVSSPHSASAAPVPTTTILQAAGALKPHRPADRGQGTPPPAEKTPTVAPRVPADSPASRSAVVQAAGVIDSSKHARRSPHHTRAAAPRPSVVIEAIGAEEVKTPMPVAAVAHPAKTPAASPTVTARRSTPLMGTLEVKPARRSDAQAVPVVPSSIQIDASLSAPPAPAPAQPPAAARVEAPGTRVTGELHVAPSGRNTRRADKAAPKPSSFHIDPSLSGEIPVAAQPAQPGHPGSQPVAQKRGDSRPIPVGRTDSQPIPGKSRHQSGSFSTVEKDFFDREADLYKQDKVESFADLDEGKAKANAKPKPKGTKPGRPYRK